MLKHKMNEVWVVYWLYYDGNPEVPLYVGMTRHLSERWSEHKNGTSTTGIDDVQRMKLNVVETVCGSVKDAMLAERRHITAALKINHKLLR